MHNRTFGTLPKARHCGRRCTRCNRQHRRQGDRGAVRNPASRGHACRSRRPFDLFSGARLPRNRFPCRLLSALAFVLLGSREQATRVLPCLRPDQPLGSHDSRLHPSPRHAPFVQVAGIPERRMVSVHFRGGIYPLSQTACRKHLGILQQRRRLARIHTRRHSRKGGFRRSAPRTRARIPGKRVRRAIRARTRRLRVAQRRRRLPRNAAASHGALAQSGRRASQRAVLRGKGARSARAYRGAHQITRSSASESATCERR